MRHEYSTISEKEDNRGRNGRESEKGMTTPDSMANHRVWVEKQRETMALMVIAIATVLVYEVIQSRFLLEKLR